MRTELNPNTTITLDPNQVALPQNQTLEEKLTEWTNETAIDAAEDREIAKQRILEAYRDGSYELNLSYLKLHSLPKDIFQELPNLEEINLNNNQLSTLPEEVFSGLKKLQELYLSGNQLSTLPKDIFKELTSLQRLFLDDNQLSTLPEEIFPVLKNLQELNLSNNRLSTLPEKTFSGLSNLQKLLLGNNQLSTLSVEVFTVLKNLQELELNCNQLSTLPENIFSGLSTLKMLSLQLNKLNTLPENIFSGLSRLKILYLQLNKLSTLPEKIFTELPNLQKLYLHNNKLSTLPKEVFTGLKKLRELELSGNQLITLPEEVFTGLKDLKWLVITHNPFIFKPSIPSNISTMIKKLPTIEEEWKKGNHSLLNFNLSFRYITGTVDARGLIKLNLMLDYANKNIDAKFAIKNSSAINQLLYLAQTLSADDTQNNHALEAANKLLMAYLDTSAVKPFAEQMNALTFDPAQYEGFVFVDPSGQQGLTVLKNCYEVNILNAPHADQHAPSASLKNGLFVHDISKNSAQPFNSPAQFKSFPLIDHAYQRTLNFNGIKNFLNTLNMGDEYKNRFIEALSVLSIGNLASLRGTTPEEKANTAPYKMIDESALNKLFDIFSALVNNNSENSNTTLTLLERQMSQLANVAASITDKHFEDICQSFPHLTTPTEQAALFFTLALMFAKYSSAPFFGTASDSPIALRYYANALLNQVKALDNQLFEQIDGSRLQATLFVDDCTDTLVGKMKNIANSNPSIATIYRQVMPTMWR